ncbi:MAG: FAD:protein transferase [Candidatus Saccharibacteria bacterium]|nr:FAD:protein transferase [Candidatus Saccharibacteria bacterium]
MAAVRGRTPHAHSSFEAIGTHWEVDLFAILADSIMAQTQLDALMRRIDQFDAVYSRFRADSLISRIAIAPGQYEFPPDAPPLFEIYHRLYELTDGAMTPLIGSVIADAGYDATYSLRPKPLQPPPKWDDIMEFQDGRLTTSAPLLLDFGAAGKGYLLDIIKMLLCDDANMPICLDAGGDIVVNGLSEPLRIGLENPDDPSQVIGVATIAQGSICGSAGNRRKWAQYTHIINPHSLSSDTDIAAVWVTAQDGLTADALTTALYFASPAKLLTVFDFEYAILKRDHSLQHSPSFPAEFFGA